MTLTLTNVVMTTKRIKFDGNCVYKELIANTRSK